MKRLWPIWAFLLAFAVSTAHATAVTVSSTTVTQIANDNTQRRNLWIFNNTTSTLFVDVVNVSSTALAANGYVIPSSGTFQFSAGERAYTGPVYGLCTAGAACNVRAMEANR